MASGNMLWINVVSAMVERLRAGQVSDADRQVLLDALGHSPDCVAPDHYRKVWKEERERAERAEADLEVSRKQARELFLQKQSAERERDQLRELLVSAEGYALTKGADRPFACMFAEDAPQVEVIERAGCYPRNARREHPGRFFLNPPPDAALSADAEPVCILTQPAIAGIHCLNCGRHRHLHRPSDAEPSRAEGGLNT